MIYGRPRGPARRCAEPQGPSVSESSRPAPDCREIFLGFLKIGVLAFGGAQAWARRVIVEERRWLSEQAYAELLGLAQILPGPNVGNMAVMLGRRLRGWRGAAAALGGFIGVPLCLLTALTFAYRGLDGLPRVDAAMQGVAAAAAGMAIGTGLRMITRLRPPPEALAIIALAALGAAWARLPLPLIVLGLAPPGIACALRRARAVR